MLMQNFGVTNKEHYGMLWYFWSGQLSNLRSENNFRAVRFERRGRGPLGGVWGHAMMRYIIWVI